MPPNLQHWSPTPIETPPTGEWIEVARRRYPASMVRAEIIVPYEAYNAVKRCLNDATLPPAIAPLYFTSDADKFGFYMAFINEVATRQLVNYLDQQATYDESFEVEFLPSEGYETLLTGYKIETCDKFIELILSVHPAPHDAALIIEAAPHIPRDHIEFVTEGIWRVPTLWLGCHTTSPLAHLRICVHDVRLLFPFSDEMKQDFAQFAIEMQFRWVKTLDESFEHSLQQNLPQNLRHLAATTLEALLCRVETALIAPPDQAEISPMVLATYLPVSAQNPLRIYPKFNPPPAASPISTKKRRLVEPITVDLAIRYEFIYMTLQFTPLADSDEIICETALPADVLGRNFIETLFIGVLQTAATSGIFAIPLVGFRVTLLDARVHQQDERSSDFQWVGESAINEVLAKGKIVIVDA